jgi:uncharacterized protein (TIGR02391 family)
MQELVREIPDVDTLLALEPEELGAKLLFLIRKRKEKKFHPGNLKNDLTIYCHNQSEAYPQHRLDEVNLALSEAFGWLQAQGLVVDAPDGAEHGWRVLSRRARKFEDEREFADYAAARHLPKKESLHPRISRSAWSAFMRGEYDVAVFEAMKAVEVAVRDASGFGADLLGKDLMREAFNPNEGPLAEGRAHLFAGAIQSYKNPGSHRDVSIEGPAEAA